jgi:putative transposase
MTPNALRRRRPRCGDKWHMDEMDLKIKGETHSLWRAVEQDGNVLDMRVAEQTEHTRSKTIFPQAPRKAPVRPARDHH